MLTNHHIAAQIAAERQRDLRAGNGGRRLRDRFATGAAGPNLARAADDVVPAVQELRFPAPGRDPHLPEPRIRRTPAGQSATWTPVSRQHRESRHGDAGRVGS